MCVKTVFFGLCCTDCSKERRLKWIWFGLTAQQLACTVLDNVVTSVTICFLVLYNSLFLQLFQKGFVSCKNLIDGTIFLIAFGIL